MRHGPVNNVMNNDQYHFEERVCPSRRSDFRVAWGGSPPRGRFTDSRGSRLGGLGTARALTVDVHMLRRPSGFLRVSSYITEVVLPDFPPIFTH